MFVTIETNGATHIAINVPHEGSDRSLPTIIAMLENNATFIRHNWRDIDIVKPRMGITLGDTFEIKEPESAEVVIQPRSEILDESFMIASPAVLISNKAAIARKDAEIDKLRKELVFVQTGP